MRSDADGAASDSSLGPFTDRTRDGASCAARSLVPPAWTRRVWPVCAHASCPDRRRLPGAVGRPRAVAAGGVWLCARQTQTTLQCVLGVRHWGVRSPPLLVCDNYKKSLLRDWIRHHCILHSGL